MYNKVNNRSPHFGHGCHPPVPPAYQQAPPPTPPPLFQQDPPPTHSVQSLPPNIGSPAPHVYLHGPTSISSTVPGSLPIQVPPSVAQNTGQSYVIPTQLHGNSMSSKTISSLAPNTHYSSNLGFQSHHIPPPLPPPPLGHSHQETSWVPGPSSRVLPPPPPPPPSSQGQILYALPFRPPPPQPGDMQNPQHSHNTPPPPPPSGSGFLAPTPDGVYLHSTVGNYQLPSVTRPPLPSSPPPIPPSPPPPTPPMTSVSSHDADFDPNPSKVSAFELKAVGSVDEVVASHPSGVARVHNSDPNKDSGSYRELAAADRDELLSTRSVILDLPPPPPQPTEENTVRKIEALCQLIAENGPDIEDKICQDEFQNPEYTFLFGGDPGTAAAISHTYFLWMKKKYNLEHRWHEKKSESQLKSVAVDSSGKQYHLHVATESTDSDMEMEDDITLSDKDQGSNYAIEALTQQQDRVDSMNENIHQLQNSTENDPAKDILSSGASCFDSVGVSKQQEGPGLLSDLERMKSARSVTKCHSPVNDPTKIVDLPQHSVFKKSAASLDDDFTQNGASGLNEASNPDKDSRQLIRSGSPIRHLQDYASDDTSDDEDDSCSADANVLTVSAGAATGVSVAQKDSGSYLDIDIGSESPSSTQNGFRLLPKISQIDSEISPHSVREFKRSRTRSVSHWTSSDGYIEHNLENQMSVNFAASIGAFQVKDEVGGTGIGSCSKSGSEQEDERRTSRFEPNILKVDKFGRHPREGPADSDSDDSRYHWSRRLNKRDRSWSRSRSPQDRRSRRRRRRRRRSPWRTRDKRSRSHSWSPRHRRSRSKSPILRRSSEFGAENVKRDKGQCLDYFRGKCYRGASCRYIHHESEKNASSRCYRIKHDLEVYSSAKKSGINEVRNQDVDLCQNVTAQQAEHSKEDSVRHAIVSTTFGLDGQLIKNDPIKSESFRKVAPEVQETLVVREEPKTLINDNDNSQKAVNSYQHHLVDGFQPKSLSGVDALKPSGGTYEDVIPSEDGSFVKQILSNVSVGFSEHSGHTSQLINASFVSDSSHDKRSMISASASKVSSNEPIPYMLPSSQQQSAPSSVSLWLSSEQPSLHSQASKEIHPHSSSSGELLLHTYQLPPPPVVLHSQGEIIMHMPQIPREYGVMQENAFFPFQFSTRGKFEPYPAPLHTQNSHFSVPPNSSWTSLPLPPSPAVYNSSLNSGLAKSYILPEFSQSQLHSRTDFASQTSVKPGLPSHSQSSEFQDRAFTPMGNHSRTFMLTEALSPKHLPQGKTASQSLAGTNLSRDDCYKQLSMQDSKFSSSTSFGGLHPQPKQLSWESDANRLQPSLDGKLPPEEHFKETSCIHLLSSQKQQSMYNLHYSASENNLRVPGETFTVSRPDVLESNDKMSLPAFGDSRISAHYNHYASTFEQPLSSKFSSSIFRQENDIIHSNNYGSSGLNHTPINREGGGGGGPRQSASSPKSATAVGQILPRSGGDQYDPLFDSIEPSSSSLKKFNFDQKQEVTGESNISLRPKSSYLSLDVEGKNKHEEVGAVASTTSQNNDEYGETADAEVGAVENESLSNHMDVANMTTGDVEINQIKSPGKRKKSKDSRSMKLFKISIANFVKEVLKPSWRQGNMSKVAFKTIVKKTVDKVSGAMKGHRVPKSQAKISQYIDSSQRKLTKLVMGYVDKYVKV